MSTKAKVYLLNTSLNHKSRMKREFHVRFCERWGGLLDYFIEDYCANAIPILNFES